MPFSSKLETAAHQKQSDLLGDWHHAEWTGGSAGLVDRADGRGQVLAASSDGAEEPGRERHLNRLC